jgi:alanine racemase
MHTRPVWVEISRQNLTANYLELCRIMHAALSPSEIGRRPRLLAVVKANAYGHGMADCARILTAAGAEWLGVTSVEEAVRARAVCPAAKILVMSGIWDGEADAVVEHRLTPLVWESFHLNLLEAEARRQGLPPRSVGVHLELDTGMSRQGVSLHGDALQEILMRFHQESALRLDGIATHFSAPEVLDGDDSNHQRSRFEAALSKVAAAGLRPGWVHAGNSATVLDRRQLAPLHAAAERIGARLMLRPGLSLYGYAPRFTAAALTIEPAVGEQAPPARVPVEAAKLSPVLTWKTRVTSLREIAPGEAAGYNSTFRAVRPTRVALLPMGYADGLNRLLSNRGSALVRGQRAPIAGRVSMDQTILDVTEVPGVAIGDEVAIIGTQGEQSQTAWELADLAGTIPYEVLCNIAARVPRVLID